MTHRFVPFLVCCLPPFLMLSISLFPVFMALGVVLEIESKERKKNNEQSKVYKINLEKETIAKKGF